MMKRQPEEANEIETECETETETETAIAVVLSRVEWCDRENLLCQSVSISSVPLPSVVISGLSIVWKMCAMMKRLLRIVWRMMSDWMLKCRSAAEWRQMEENLQSQNHWNRTEEDRGEMKSEEERDCERFRPGLEERLERQRKAKIPMQREEAEEREDEQRIEMRCDTDFYPDAVNDTAAAAVAVAVWSFVELS
jgi:hypothetical protein